MIMKKCICCGKSFEPNDDINFNIIIPDEFIPNHILESTFGARYNPINDFCSEKCYNIQLLKDIIYQCKFENIVLPPIKDDPVKRNRTVEKAEILLNKINNKK